MAYVHSYICEGWINSIEINLEDEWVKKMIQDAKFIKNCTITLNTETKKQAKQYKSKKDGVFYITD